jgi:hypothetical protein
VRTGSVNRFQTARRSFYSEFFEPTIRFSPSHSFKVSEQGHFGLIRRKIMQRAYLLLCLLASPLALAQSTGGPYTLRKFAVAGGGGQATAPGLRVVNTVGQIAGVFTGGSYRLTGGFHKPANAPGKIFCDGFETTTCN